jgi:hypothetical protein
MAGIFLVLDAMHYREMQFRTPLCHDGGKLLQCVLDRYSIPRQQCRIGYCFEGQKKSLPKKRTDIKRPSYVQGRDRFLIPHLVKLHEKMKLAKKDLGKIEVIGLGRLACECLTGNSVLKRLTGTTWKVKDRWKDIVEKAWITGSTDAALFDPQQITEITGVLVNAAERAGIKTEFREIGMFDWSNYI